MKKKLLFIVFIISFLEAVSQEKVHQKKDTTKVRVGNTTVLLINKLLANDQYDYDLGKCDSLKSRKKNRSAISVDFGTNGYIDRDNRINLSGRNELMEVDYSRSRSFGISIMGKGLNIVNERIYLSPGIGLNWNNYFFKNDINISTSNDTTAFLPNSGIEYDKYKLKVAYLQVPLIVGFKIGNKEKPLGVQLGVIGSYKIASGIKQKFTIDETKSKIKLKDNYNIQPFKLDAIVRIAIGDFGIFTRYSFTSLFEKDKAPELYPISAGITFGGFLFK